MNELFKIEWMKIRHYKAFQIIFIFLILGILASNFIVYKVFQSIMEDTNAGRLVNNFNLYDYQYVWQTTSYVSGYVLILPAMLLVFLTTNEFTYKTHRQNIIDGWSRKQFFDVKVYSAFLLALVTTVMVIITGVIFGFTGTSSFTLSGFSHVGYFFIKAFSYNMIALLISVLIRRTGFATGMFFIYLFAENFISQLLEFWSMRIKIIGGPDLGSMGDYLPMNASDGLLNFPDNPLKNIAKGNMPSDYKILVFVLAIGYLALFYFWIKRKMLRSDW